MFHQLPVFAELCSQGYKYDQNESAESWITNNIPLYGSAHPASNENGEGNPTKTASSFSSNPPVLPRSPPMAGATSVASKKLSDMQARLGIKSSPRNKEIMQHGNMEPVKVNKENEGQGLTLEGSEFLGIDTKRHHFCGVQRLGYLSLGITKTENNEIIYVRQWTRDCRNEPKPLVFDVDGKPLANPDDAYGAMNAIDTLEVAGHSKSAAKRHATVENLIAMGINRRNIFLIMFDGDRISIGLKWTATDGSSPLAILLSKHSAEIAAQHANTSVALDCADPEVLKRWNDAVHSQTEEQQCKQVGYKGKGKEATTPTSSEREEMRWTETRPDGMQIEHVRRQTISVDSEKRMAVVQQAEARLEMLHDYTLKQFGLAKKNFSVIWDRCDKIEDVVISHNSQIEKLKLTTHTQGEKMRYAEENIKEMKLQRSYDKIRQAEKEKEVYDLKSTVKKARMQHEQELSDAKNLCKSLKSELEECKATLRDQAERDKNFDDSHAENCKGYDDAINDLINRIADLEDEKSVNTSSKGTSSKGTSSKGVSKTPMTVKDVVERMMAPNIHVDHLKVNGNPSRECRQPVGLRRLEKEMQDIDDVGRDQTLPNSREVLQRPESSFQIMLNKNIFDNRINKEYRANTECKVYQMFNYNPLDYFTSGEFAKDQAKRLLFSHPLCFIYTNSRYPYLKIGTNKGPNKDFMMKEDFFDLKGAFEARRNACSENPNISRTTKLARKNFEINKRAKLARGIEPPLSLRGEEGCSSASLKRASNNGCGGRAQQSKKPRLVSKNEMDKRGEAFMQDAYQDTDVSETDHYRDSDSDYLP